MPSYSGEVLADSPAVYHKTQETSGLTATDSSGNSRPATYAGGVTLNDTSAPALGGNLGRHVYLDGVDDHLALDATTWFTPAGGFTWEGWFYIRSWTNWVRLFDFANTANSGDMYFIANNTGTLTLNVGSSMTCARFSTGVWHHVVVTVSATGAAVVYDNGSVHATGQLSAPTNASRQFKYVGKSQYAADPYLSASVAHVAVYNQVLSGARVTAHYDARTTLASGNVAIAASQVPADLTRFVVRVDLSKLANFWTGVDSTLSNLRVRDGFGNDLPFDLASYDYAANTGILYFRSDLSSSSDQLFQIAGVVGATPPAVTDPLGRNAVWADYDLVFTFEGNQNLDRAGKVSALTLGSGVSVSGGRLNFAGAGAATISGLTARTSWTQALTFQKADTTPATLFKYGSVAKIGLDSGTTLGVHDGTWLHPSPNPALANNQPYRAHQVWDAAASRTVYREGGSLAGGGGAQATDTTVTQQNGTDITVGSNGGAAEPLTGWIDRLYLRPQALSAQWVATEERSWEDDALLSYSAPTATPTITATEPAVSSVTVRWSATSNTTGYEARVDGGTVVTVPAGQLYYDATGFNPNTAHTIEIRAINPLGSGPWASTNATTLTATYFDSFNRADSTNTPGTPGAGGPYTVVAGTWGINGNALYASASTSEAQMTFPGLVNFDMTLKVSAIGPSGGLLFRWVDASNTWMLQWTTAGYYFFRRTAGTWAQQGNGWVRPPAANDVVRVIGVGRTLLAYRNGALIATAEDHYFGVATATMGYRFHTDTTTRLNEAVLQPGVLPSNPPGDVPTPETFLTDPAHDSGFLYKGRDTKLADEGAVP